ncbi:MAG: tetraacyldisaccharide 4'-kinase [Luteimonas sp.]
MSDASRNAPAWWYSGASVPWGARLLSGLYAVVIQSRLLLYRHGLLRRTAIAAPVVIVGNLTAGGSGKTPLTMALVERLRAGGWTPGVATRGHGRDNPNQPLWVDAATDPAQGGDEPVLIARRTGVKVRADRDRVTAANALVAAGCDIVVCDDGLQHYRLARNIEIEVIDGRRRHGNGLMLPAGPLREPAPRAAICDFHVVNLPLAAHEGSAGFGEWPMRLHADRAYPVLGGRSVPLSTFTGQRVHAVAGIGDPERYFGMLRGFGIAVVPHAFGDHHRYVQEDFQFASDLPVLMTEKDAVKCAGFATPRHYSIPVQAELPEAFWVALLDRLRTRTEQAP